MDHRSHPRVSLACALQVQPLNPPTDELAHCSRYSESCDISESGMQLRTERPYPVQSRVLLTFECEELGETRITSRVGTVMWFKPQSIDGQCLLGVKFGDA